MNPPELMSRDYRPRDPSGKRLFASHRAAIVSRSNPEEFAMTSAEQYEFDLNGIIVYRNLIDPARVKKINQLLDTKFGQEFPWSFQFIEDDPCYMELMELPRTMAILRTMLGDWFRLDHAYGL